MTENDNQTATTSGKTPFSLLIANVIEWSVQGSNLRPPVNVGSRPTDSKPAPGLSLEQKLQILTRRIHERAASDDNQTAIPDPYRSSMIFMAWGWAA